MKQELLGFKQPVSNASFDGAWHIETKHAKPAIVQMEVEEPEWRRDRTAGYGPSVQDLVSTLRTELDPELQAKLTKRFVPGPYAPTPRLADCKALPEVPGPLALQNPHPNDQRICFVDVNHRYYINGSCSDIVSSTTLIGFFFEPFDSLQIATNKFHSKTFRDTVHRPSHELHGCKCPADIIKVWDHWRDLGTAFHKTLELHVNGMPFQVHEENKVCFEQFQRLWSDAQWVRWSHFRTEWSVFDPICNIAGQIDYVGRLPNGELVIIDWKRTKGISDVCFNRFRKLPAKKGKGPCARFDSCKFIKYSLQVNLYKYILETYYGYKVRFMYIAQFHPNLRKKGPKVYQAPNMQSTIKEMLAVRLRLMNSIPNFRRIDNE